MIGAWAWDIEKRAWGGQKHIAFVNPKREYRGSHMHPDVINAISEEALLSRKRGQALLVYADQLEETVRQASELLERVAGPNGSGEATGTPVVNARIDMPVVRTRRKPVPSMPQADACEQILRAVGGRDTIESIFAAIRTQNLPVRVSNIDNLRSSMSRDPRFTAFGNGVWGLVEPDLSSAPQTTRLSTVTLVNGSGLHEFQNGHSQPKEETP